MDVLQKHHNTPPSEIIEWYRFHTRIRRQDESISAFVAELCAIAENCNFGETLNTMLRDHVICGMNNEQHAKEAVV